MKSRAELLAEAELLEVQAQQNDAYCCTMERTTAKTNGLFGHLNNPTAYAAHKEAAAVKRLRAAQLRMSAQEMCGGQK